MKCTERIIFGALVLTMSLGVSIRLTNAQTDGARPGDIRKVPGPSKEIIVAKANAAEAKKKPAIEYKIGDTGPAGGIIFYDKGSFSDGWRYLEVAPEDQSHRIRWNWEKDDELETGAKAAGPGSGKENTAKIVAAYGDGAYAAKLCVDYRGGGKSDWYLPSIEELDLMYENLKKPGLVKFNGRFCWSSTEYDAKEAVYLTFGFGRKSEEKKRGEGRVRAVRRF